MAAPAMAGLKPALTIRGIMVGPKAARQPAADGMAIATHEAISMQKGSRKKPSLPKGLTIIRQNARHSGSWIPQRQNRETSKWP